jgi:hypothetical protein
MRKFILITALVLASASAQAGALRGLTVASNEEPVAAEPSKAADVKATDVKPVDDKATDTKSSEAPKFIERPAAVDAPADQPKADASKPVPDKRVDKPRRRRESTEARVIYELHRHGIYW